MSMATKEGGSSSAILTMRAATVQNIGVEALLTAIFIAGGFVIGSFLNVCIDRLPSGGSIINPPWSKCDQCQRRLSPLDLIPVFSYLWLRGRCRYCQATLPKRLVVVEVVTGVLLGALYLILGWGPEFGVAGFWACVFVVIFVIDLEQGLILNKIVYPCLLIALVFAGFVDLSWLDGWSFLGGWPAIAVSALGGVVGFLLFFLLAEFSVRVLGKEGLGEGDVKLAALIGFICGFPLVALVMVLGAVVGLLMALPMGRLKGNQTMPFGSALVVATMVSMLWGHTILDWVAKLYG
jgi:leader peptidase (prepilin peptidase)/N-methyltransferase